MISNNIFRVIGELFSNFLFAPYDAIRSIDGWWASNFLNSIFFIITAGLFIYWIGQLQQFKKAKSE